MSPLLHPECIDYNCVRKALYETGHTALNEHTVKIISLLTKRKPLSFTDEQRENFIFLFHRIQEPFDKHSNGRKNFLSYAYVTLKFCQLYGYTEFYPVLPRFKSPRNLNRADAIWRSICTDCGFPFMATPWTY